VSFPDFPGCISAGDTLDEALANASEALGGHMRLMEADGGVIPKPRTLDDILKDEVLADERERAVVLKFRLSVQCRRVCE
jgi:predicted RNase H-like HicB family nuclease